MDKAEIEGMVKTGSRKGREQTMERRVRENGRQGTYGH